MKRRVTSSGRRPSSRRENYPLQFRVTDIHGATDTIDIVVNVHNVNRPPVISVERHAVMLGNPLQFNVVGSDPDSGTSLIYSIDEDTPLAEPTSRRPACSPGRPGPGQAGDHLVRFKVSDGSATTTKTIVIRAVGIELKPTITFETTPSFPAVPGQDVRIHVLASSYGAIANLTLTVDGQPVTLDANGRATVRATAPGFINLVATTTDVDGFTRRQVARHQGAQSGRHHRADCHIRSGAQRRHRAIHDGPRRHRRGPQPRLLGAGDRGEWHG